MASRTYAADMQNARSAPAETGAADPTGEAFA
jgi:hypothetical protein